MSLLRLRMLIRLERKRAQIIDAGWVAKVRSSPCRIVVGFKAKYGDGIWKHCWCWWYPVGLLQFVPARRCKFGFDIRSMESSLKSKLNTVSYQILRHFLSILPLPDLPRLRQVCRCWSSLSIVPVLRSVLMVVLHGSSHLHHRTTCHQRLGWQAILPGDFWMTCLPITVI